MFGEMRSLLGIPKSVDIMRHVNSLPPAERQDALAGIREIETRAMRNQQPQPGLSELMAYLAAKGIPKAICTRNCLEPVTHLMETFLHNVVFDPIVARDSGHEMEGRELRPKPSADGVLYIAGTWGVGTDGDTVVGVVDVADAPKRRATAQDIIMVGDGGNDMEAGRRAGAATILLVNDVNRRFADHEHTDLVIDRLDELIQILEHGFEGRNIDFML